MDGSVTAQAVLDEAFCGTLWGLVFARSTTGRMPRVDNAPEQWFVTVWKPGSRILDTFIHFPDMKGTTCNRKGGWLCHLWSLHDEASHGLAVRCNRRSAGWCAVAFRYAHVAVEPFRKSASGQLPPRKAYLLRNRWVSPHRRQNAGLCPSILSRFSDWHRAKRKVSAEIGGAPPKRNLIRKAVGTRS